jgi:hypothetical protein
MYQADRLRDQAMKDGNWMRAFEEMAREAQRLYDTAIKLQNSRFVRISPCESGYSVQKVTERTISEHYDLSDLHGGEGDDDQFFCLGSDGKLHPVTAGRMERINTDEECPFHYAASDLIANGEVVGSVTYTDH